jgi:ribonuclease HI
VCDRRVQSTCAIDAPRSDVTPTRYVSITVSTDPILVFTDGACSGNPGPAGVGIVLVCGTHRKELSEYLGEATNNIAELTAIIRALELIKDPSRSVTVYSDSQYAIGLISKNWKAKANVELVQRARILARTFSQLRFEWVRGHAGHVENERCDELARTAITNVAANQTTSNPRRDRPRSPG